MTGRTRVPELRKEVDAMNDKILNTGESASRAEKGIEELRLMLAALLRNLQEGGGGPSHTTTENRGQNFQAEYQLPIKCSTSRVSFPHFSGDDLRGWVCRCDQFFEVDETPSFAKVKIAAIHLQGKALRWHQTYMKYRITGDVPSWEEYVRALNDRFGSMLYEDPMSELVNLKQTSSVQNYLDQFDELLNCVSLPQNHAMSCFLGGLKPEISLGVRMFKPDSLQEAVRLARLQEQALTYHTIPPSFTRPSQPPLIPSIRLMSPQELDEKRAKGLCVWCDEKFSMDHHCPRKTQLYLMEIHEEDSEDYTQDHTPNSHVSMHAMAGLHDFRTMRITGAAFGEPIHILIDTVSTHNFLDFECAKRLGCRLEETRPFPVAVADGSIIHSRQMCKEFIWRMQSVLFTTDFMILPMGGCDMVLGIQWLVTLGDINWNFDHLIMGFFYKGKRVTLRGLQPTSGKASSFKD